MVQDRETVFIVDDDAASRDSLAALVQVKGLKAKTYETAKAFLDDFDPEARGCLITDVRMPGMSGLDLQQQLNQRGCVMPVIIITGYGDISTAVAAMSAGAVTFLEKGCNDSELWQNIQHALDKGTQGRTSTDKTQEMKFRLASLTSGEMAVLRSMLAGRMNKEIKKDLDIGLRTVEMRRSNIMKKLGAESLAQAVRLALIGGVEPAGGDEKQGV